MPPKLPSQEQQKKKQGQGSTVEKTSAQAEMTLDVVAAKNAELEAKVGRLEGAITGLAETIDKAIAGMGAPPLVVPQQPNPSPNPALAVPQVSSQPLVQQGQGQANPLAQALIGKLISGESERKPSALEGLAMRSLETDIKLKETIMNNLIGFGLRQAIQQPTQAGSPPPSYHGAGTEGT